MAVLKVIEILSESATSWEDAARAGVAKASESLRGVRSAYVQEQSATVENGQVKTFRVNLKITFEVEK